MTVLVIVALVVATAVVIIMIKIWNQKRQIFVIERRLIDCNLNRFEFGERVVDGIQGEKKEGTNLCTLKPLNIGLLHLSSARPFCKILCYP